MDGQNLRPLLFALAVNSDHLNVERSSVNLVQPYAFVGCCGVSSEMGAVSSGRPYVAHVEEKTMRLTPQSTNSFNKEMP
jgi:hypothetical protein